MPFVEVERTGDTAILRLDRPPANALDLDVAAEMHARLDALTADVPPGGVVLTGAGRLFSGGVDFKAVPAYSDAQRATMLGHVNAAMTALYALPTATVAAVNGHAIGGAFVLVLACDARIAADVDLKLALTEVTAGIPYPACPMQVVLAELDPGLRRHLVLTGDALDPRSAHARGVIDEVVAPDALLARAVELARARASARAYARVKEQLKGDVVARMRSVIARGDDPMLRQWL